MRQCEYCNNKATVSLDVKGLNYSVDKSDMEYHDMCTPCLKGIDWVEVKMITIIKSGASKELSMFDRANDFLIPNNIIIPE